MELTGVTLDERQVVEGRRLCLGISQFPRQLEAALQVLDGQLQLAPVARKHPEHVVRLGLGATVGRRFGERQSLARDRPRALGAAGAVQRKAEVGLDAGA
jgi:hypothetical protein